MQISLHQLRQEEDGVLELEGNVPMDSLVREVPGLVRLEPVQVRAKLFLLDPHLVKAEVEQSTEATFTCSRCLIEFRSPVCAAWEERFTDEARRAVDTADEEIHLIQGETLDLDPYIREAVLLQLPYVPVCREDCLGLCPNCGANRNKVNCGCRIESIDPRLAVLEELFKQGEENDQ